MEDCEFLVQCKVLVEERKVDDLLLILKNSDNNERISYCGWELVGIFFQHLNQFSEEEVTAIKSCLNVLLEVCSSKEMILALVEQISSLTSFKDVVILVDACSQTLLKLKSKQSIHLEDVTKEITKYMENALSDKDSVEAEEEYEHSDTKDELETMYDCICKFTSTMVAKVQRRKCVNVDDLYSETTSNDWCEYEITQSRNILFQFLLCFLGILVKKNILFSFHGDWNKITMGVHDLMSFSQLLEHIAKENLHLDSVGFVAFLHITFVQSIQVDQFPVVYRCDTLFQLASRHIAETLRISADDSVRMSLDLLNFLLKPLEDKIFSRVAVETFSKIALGLSNVMIWCQQEKLRQNAKEIFSLYLLKIQTIDKYLILRSVYDQSQHAGLRGYLIKFITTALVEFYDMNEDVYVKDVSTLALSYTELVLGESNILNESDRLMAGLNFVRFWLLKDPRNENKTGVWNLKDLLRRNFQVIRKCADVSKLELESALQNVENTSCEEMIEVVIPGGEAVKNFSQSQKYDVIQAASVCLDLMLSIVAVIDKTLTWHSFLSEKDELVTSSKT
ncbi:glomulin-like [Hydractinia symbiolongicarpus]|uniref:glomulin-like n=1 Tax=Hydractinia symbiolongicarpus TaxID=13093 RepID=UPI00254D756A|nr:glomulin-like [Hydractinia symbiolongicarpus]